MCVLFFVYWKGILSSLWFILRRTTIIVNETSEEHESSGTELILKKIEERDIKRKINLSNTETQHMVEELS